MLCDVSGEPAERVRTNLLFFAIAYCRELRRKGGASNFFDTIAVCTAVDSANGQGLKHAERASCRVLDRRIPVSIAMVSRWLYCLHNTLRYKRSQQSAVRISSCMELSLLYPY